MLNAATYWISIAEVKSFTTDANQVFTISEMESLVEILALDPMVGDVIPDTNGVRLVRWPATSQGKNGCVRVIYYFRDLNTPVYLLALYEKGERLNLSSAERRIIRALVDEIVAAYGVKLAALHSPSGAA